VGCLARKQAGSKLTHLNGIGSALISCVRKRAKVMHSRDKPIVTKRPEAD